MYTLKELLKRKKDNEELLDLPIEDFVGWDGWTAMIDSHIEAFKKLEETKRQVGELVSAIYEHANEGTALMELAEKIDEE